jgi:hypothetical protein
VKEFNKLTGSNAMQHSWAMCPVLDDAICNEDSDALKCCCIDEVLEGLDFAVAYLDVGIAYSVRIGNSLA